MKEKPKNRKETSENIKTELKALLKLNRKRKAALQKLSKSILDAEGEVPFKEDNSITHK